MALCKSKENSGQFSGMEIKEKAKPPMLMPWQMPDPLKPSKNQDRAVFKPHYIDYRAAFEVDSPVAPISLTPIMGTIGPKCSDVKTLCDLFEEGVRIVRIDVAVGTRDDHVRLIERIKEAVHAHSVEKQRVIPIAIMLDMKGPEILTGSFADKEFIRLQQGDVITLTTNPAFDDRGTEDRVYIDYKNLPFIIRPRDKILLDNGRIELHVRGAVDFDIVCEVAAGGDLYPHRNLAVPAIPLDLPTVSPKDKEDLLMAVDQKVEAICAPLITNANDMRDIRKIMGERGKGIQIFAKIDNKFALHNIDDIIMEANGIIVNRGSLSTELSTEKVMLAQKMVFAKCNKAGKPVFAMTEFLNSMIHLDCPTIAEVTDVTQAILDGADGLILNEETSMGDHPAHTVRTLATLCKQAEAETWQHELFDSLNIAAEPPVDPAHAISIATVEASMKAHVSAILVVTTSGRSARLIAKYRPRCPIYAITRYGAVARKLNLVRGVLSVQYIASPHPCWPKEVDLRLQYAIELGKISKVIKPGDPLLLVSGWRQGSGFTNNIRFVYSSLTDPWTYPHSPAKHEEAKETSSAENEKHDPCQYINDDDEDDQIK